MCENEKKKYHSIEMTTGSLWKNILLFSLPLMGSQVLEVLFNLSDVAVVGRFADYMALGAVGSTTLLVTLFTGILIGMGAGVNVRVAHELGAGNKKRMLKSYRVSLTYAFIFGAILGGLLLVFGPQFLSLFATEPTVIDAGMQRIRIMAFSYAFSCFMDGSIAASRGIGKSIPPTIIVILGSCVFRIVWIYTVFAHFQTISSLYLLYIFSWGITGLAETLFFVVSFKKIGAGK